MQKSIYDIDKEFVWHPYASKTNPARVNVASKSHGAYIQLNDDKNVIDGISSWWCMAHGHNVEYIKNAVKKQLDDMPHVMFAGLTHQAGVTLAEKIAKVTPNDLNNVFFLDSGSVAVEAAIKMAIQYQYAQKKSKKNKIITLSGGYHGDTVFAMALCDREQGMHKIFNGILPEVLFAAKPTCKFDAVWQDSYLDNFRQIFEQHQEEIAGVILEPIFQGASAMNFYHPNYLKGIREICTKNDSILIFDEIATGFGRTGKYFAMNHANVTPDIVCIGKALTGGVITLAAAVTNNQVAEMISKNPPQAFMHGPTFMANPLACAAANASLELFTQYDWESNVKNIENQLKDELKNARNLPHVIDVRVLGAIGVIEFDYELDCNQVSQLAIQNGVWLRPFSRYLYTMPPFICTTSEISKICQAMLTITTTLCEK